MTEEQSQVYEFDEFRLDVSKRVLTKGDLEQIPLTPKVFDTLLYLVRNGGKVIGKDELMREIWTDSIVEENNLNQNISILRRTFGEKPGQQRFIVTVAGHGYRFVPTVQLISDPGSENADLGTNQNLNKKDDVKTAPDPPPKIRDRILVAGLAATALIVAAAGIFFLRPFGKVVDSPIRTIAVLPFKPLVTEHRNEALELGMADGLISKLSGGEEFVVRPLGAIRRFTSVEQDPLAAGRELGVESVLDGSIQTWGDRIRVSVKLFRTSDGKQLWAGQFDERFNDIFAVQDSISERVAEALKVRLGVKPKTRSTDNIEAYQLYMKGRYQTAKGTPTDLRASISYFEQAIELDPEYALAYTGLAKAYGVLGIFGELRTREAFPKARAAERKALEIDDTLGDAHLSMCMGLFWYDWDWAAAESECRRAIEIDPNNAEFHGYYATLLSSTGRHDEALAEAKRSRELNPLDLAQSAFEGQFLLHAGRTDEAIEHLRKLAELEPNFPFTHLFAASAYVEKGMFREAIAAAQKEFALTGRNDVPFGTYALARSGRSDEVRATLNELLKSTSTDYVSPYKIAMIYQGLEEREKAIDWLEKGYEQRDPKMTFLKVEPKWHSLRNEPRFVDLMRRMNFQ